MRPGMLLDALESLGLIVPRAKSIAGMLSAVLSCCPKLEFRRAPQRTPTQADQRSELALLA
eukprot:1078732-Pyramimonas_sp.AAC.1